METAEKTNFLRKVTAQKLVQTLLAPINKNIQAVVEVHSNYYVYVDKDGVLQTEKLDAITKPILYGQYSKIPEKYIINNFPEIEYSLINMIVNKEAALQYYIEVALDIDLLPDQELWSRLDIDIYK